MTNSDEYRGGPWLKAAFLCENVLQERDGVASYVRVVDQITAESRAWVKQDAGSRVTLPEDLPNGVMLNSWLVVAFTSGGAVGRSTLEMKLRGPNGLVSALGQPQDVHFDGRQNSSVTAHVQLNMVVRAAGLHAVEVLLDGTKVTEIPFEIRYQRGTIQHI